MLNTFIFKGMLIVCVIISNLDGLKGLLLCGDLGALVVYSPDKMLCCNKMLFERVDEYKRERDCCSNTPYYTDVYDCVNGRLITLNRPDPLSSALNVPMDKKDIVGKVFTSLPLCGDLRAAEVYNPDEMFCCNKTLFERVDEYRRERDCCSNTPYYTDVYDCVNGRLITLNRPHPLSSALNVPVKKEDIVGNVFTNLPLCGDLRAAEVYNPDEMFCCNKTLFQRFDEYERERDCCSSRLYYTDVYDCVDGMLINFNRPYPLSRTSKSPMEKEAIGGIVRSFYIAWETDMRPTTQTDNSERELEDSA